MKESYHGADGLLAEMVSKMPNVALKVLDKCVTNEGEEKVYDFFPLQTVQGTNLYKANNFLNSDLT